MQLISWENLDDYIIKGITAQLPVTSSSDICFLVEGSGNSLRLRMPVAEDVDVKPSPYRELDICKKSVHESHVIELTVKDARLFRTFYHFSIEILQLLLIQGMPEKQAIESCLGNWAQLLVQRKLLEETAQVGLAGELCLLRALIVGKGKEAFNSWLGPIKEPHDFRLESNEIEVKSTLQSRRIHRIHGFGQLEPSIGMKLYMLSLQFEPAGNAKVGKTLVERIDGVRRLLSGSGSSSEKFEDYLTDLGYVDSDATFYTQKLKFRNPPVLIPITAEFPRLTRSMVDQSLPEGTAQRVTHVEYEVDVDGLGHPEGCEEFAKVLNGLGQLENWHD